MATLYELTGEYKALMEMAEDTDIDPDVLSDTLEAVGGEIEDKADNYAKMIRNLVCQADAIDSEILRLKIRSDALNNHAERIHEALEKAMIQTGKKKFKTTLFSFGVQRNAPSLDVIDEESIPEEFWIPQKPKLNRKAALDYVKKNGDQKWGRKKQTESLRIR